MTAVPISAKGSTGIATKAVFPMRITWIGISCVPPPFPNVWVCRSRSVSRFAGNAACFISSIVPPFFRTLSRLAVIRSKLACTSDANCAAVYDFSCDNTDFSLCKNQYLQETSVSSCLYIQGGKHILYITGRHWILCNINYTFINIQTSRNGIRGRQV